MATDFVSPGTPASAPPAPQTPLQRALAKLALWEAAEDAIATSQSYEIDGRKLTRANLSEVHRMVIYYEDRVARLQAGRGCGPRRTSGVPRG